MLACLMWLVWKERDSCMFEKDEGPLWIFGIHWLLPYTMPTLLFGWRNWFRKHSPDVWNLMPACLMWLVWKERDSRMFEKVERPLWIFGIHWLLPYTMPTLLSGWRNWFRKHSPDVWNLMPTCLMWLVWKERDSPMFEDAERSLDQL